MCVFEGGINSLPVYKKSTVDSQQLSTFLFAC